MFLYSIFKYLKQIFRVLPHIYIGRFPKDAPPGSLLFFPNSPNLLRCGLACILEVKESKVSSLSRIFSHAKDLISELDMLGFEEPRRIEIISSISQEIQVLKQSAPFFELFIDIKKQHELSEIVQRLQTLIVSTEKWLDHPPSSSTLLLERVNAEFTILKDIKWCVEKEILENIHKIGKLCGIKSPQNITQTLVAELRRLNALFNSIDRIEVRGRDSAGFSCIISIEDISSFYTKINDLKLSEELNSRLGIKNLVNGTIRISAKTITFIFKISAEIGQLGDNVRRLRDLVTNDHIFLAALSLPLIRASYLSHTRWASNGIISVPNCHPLDNEAIYSGVSSARDLPESHPYYPKKRAHLYGVLNGDIDNYPALKEQFEKESGGTIAPEITTDAKIILLAIETQLLTGLNMKEAFRRAVNSFEGSHAIAVQSDLEPDKLYLALKGSGQAIYIGLSKENFMVASEVYGLVEESSTYLSMDGESQRVHGDPNTQGQVFILHPKEGPEGIEALWYDGHPLDIGSRNLKKAEITTRDLDRRGFEHFFIKEIHEAPDSIKRTMRGKFSLEGDGPYLNLGSETLYPEFLQALCEEKIRKIYCIGQGTASIAAKAIAFIMGTFLQKKNIRVNGCKASELSGFLLSEDMSDTLIIAVTQSGTTTDTNRAVDMARGRGAYTMAIVNRRNSHVTEKVKGVLYTSDGRDIEMSVASTKAFYSQVVAGEILALSFAQALKTFDSAVVKKHLEDLIKLPALLKSILDNKEEIAEAAARFAPTRKYWAVVGSGPNKIAAKEIRIKLSELCYKSIACDFIEDKKHIDLSAEPLILVCTAGTPDNVIADAVKDVAIFKAHRALPIVITHEGEERFSPYCAATFHTPRTTSTLSIILNTLAGHLWGYYAARAINNQSVFFNDIRLVVSRALEKSKEGFMLFTDRDIQSQLEHFWNEFHKRKREGYFSGTIKPETCTDIALLLKYVAGKSNLVDFELEFGYPPQHDSIAKELLSKLTLAIGELSRPIDAIKHQAKTVTVGTSRIEDFPSGILFNTIRTLGISINELSYKSLAYLKSLQNAVKTVLGWVRYEVMGLDNLGEPDEKSYLKIKTRGGISAQIPSRIDKNPTLVGTKRSVVQKREVYVGIGKRDGRKIIIIPLIDCNYQISSLMLLQINFVETLPIQNLKAIIGTRYDDIKNQVMESNIMWTDDLLSILPPELIITQPPELVAEQIISRMSGKPQN